MPVIAVVGSLLLISVFLVRPGRYARLWMFAITMTIVPVVLTFAAGNLTGRFGGVFPTSQSESLLRGATTEVQRIASAPPDYVILIEGASWSTRAVAGPQLEASLRSRGIDAAVIQMTLPGASHFERSYLLDTLADGLTPEQLTNLSDSNLVLLSEISRYYDSSPLEQVTKNLFTDRMYGYLSPSRTFTLAEAAIAEGRMTPLLAVQLAQNAAFNWLRIGEMQRIETPHEEVATDGYRPFYETNKAPPIRRLDDIVAFIESDQVAEPQSSPWFDRSRGLGASTFGFPVDTTILFETPTWNPENNRYARSFALQSKYPTILIGDPDLYHELADPDLWYNVSHLRRGGAEIYTTWLTDRLVDILGTRS